MPKLKFLSITCHRPNDLDEADSAMYDISIEDEPYLLVNHKKVWSGGRMNVNDEKDLSHVEPIPFDNTIDIQLWDQDASPTGTEDDLLGRLTVQAYQAGLGVQKNEFKQKKSKYTLSYIVE